MLREQDNKKRKTEPETGRYKGEAKGDVTVNSRATAEEGKDLEKEARSMLRRMKNRYEV
jgi:hypothetical protein